MKTPVEKNPHLGVDRPHSNADLARRARRSVSAGDRFEDGEPRTGFDSLNEDRAVAGESKAVERIPRGANDESVIVFAATGARPRGDLGVEVSDGEIMPHAGEINAGLHNNGQPVAADRGASLIGYGSVP